MAASEEVVSRIWDESRDRLRGFIAKRIDDPSDVDDVLQEVFVKIYQKIDKLEDPDKLYAWVFQTTRNAIADYYREGKGIVVTDGDDLDAIATEQEDNFAEEEVLSWLEPMIGELPDKDREALSLADIDGLTQRELAEKLDISLSGAKSRVQRAREKLKDELLRCCHLEFDRAGKIVEYRQRKDGCGACQN